MSTSLRTTPESFSDTRAKKIAIRLCYNKTMPKLVDHERRRRELTQAVWRVIRRDGVAAASVRAVAAESGWSVGALRHYFTNQDELLRFAIELMIEQVARRVGRLVGEYGGPSPERAQQLLEQLLPLDEEREVEVLVWLAFTDRARVDTTFAAVRAQGWDGTRHVCRLAIADLCGARDPVELGAALPTATHETAAALVHTFVDGLALQGIAYPDRMPPPRQRAALRQHLAAVTRT